MERSRRHSSDDIDLGDLTSRLLARWYVLVAAAVVAGAAVFLVSRTLPKTYESRATIFVQQNSVASSLLKNLPLGLGGGAGGDSSGYLLTLLQSETMLRDVVSSLDLTRYPKFRNGEGRSVETAVKRLRESLFVAENRNGGIDIVARASNPYLAARIANKLLDNLDKLVVTGSKRKADYIATKLDETNRGLRKAEDELLEFQERSDVASIEDETKGMIQQLIELDGRLLALDMELKQVETDLENGGELNTLVETEVRRKSLASGRELLSAQQQGLQSKLASLPAVAVRYARLQRRVAVLSKTFELLTEQYQLATISQHGEDGDYQIIDRATPRMKPVLPRAMLNTAIAAMLSFFVAGLAVAGSGRSSLNKRTTSAPYAPMRE